MPDTHPDLHPATPTTPLAYAEWRADLRGQGPTLLMVHATGFHGRVWDQVIGHLPNCHIISVDQRGHGRTPGEPVKDWSPFGQDLVEFVDALGLSTVHGIGHSMGAHALTQAAAARPEVFDRLILIDPVILPPQFYQHGTAMFPKGFVHPASKRQRHFGSSDEMLTRFKDRAPYSYFQPEALRDYCAHALRVEDDGLTLCCAPEVEASVYVASITDIGILDTIASIETPILLLRAKLRENWGDMDYSTSPTWPELVTTLKNGQEIFRPDLTHFLPMEDPEWVAEVIKDGL